MKATFDLPPELIRQLKIRAVNEGRKLRDSVADVLRAGLRSEPTDIASMPTPKIVISEITGLPVIVCPKAAPPGEEATPDRISDILLAQEVDWHSR